VHVLFNLMGAVLWLPFIGQLAGLAEAVSPAASHLQGVQRLAEEVPRQIANAATIWATANTLIFLPFAALFAKLAVWLIPDRPAAAAEAAVRPLFLDHTLDDVPSMALQQARLELGRMGQLTEAMLGQVRAGFQARRPVDLAASHGQLVVLRDAVVAHLQRVGRGALSNGEADEHAALVVAAGEVESLSTAIACELAPMLRAMHDAGIVPSADTGELLDRVFQATEAATHAALQTLVQSDARAADGLAAQREGFRALGAELLRRQSARLAQDDPDRLLKHRMQFELLDKLRRVYGAAEHMALSAG
jgi:phosphate:Na+ symporter